MTKKINIGKGPAIRDEKWEYPTSFAEGKGIIDSQDMEKTQVRFSGLLMKKMEEGENEDDKKQILKNELVTAAHFKDLFESLSSSDTTSLCIDWFDKLEDNALSKLPEAIQSQLDALLLIKLPFQTPSSTKFLIPLLKRPIRDLQLSFCSLTDKSIVPLCSGLNGSPLISLNLNMNYLTKEGFRNLGKALEHNDKLRYLEAKRNKADAKELKSVIGLYDKNHSLEYIDFGQEDKIEGDIEQNKLSFPEGFEQVRKENKNEEEEDGDGDLKSKIKEIIVRNSSERKAREKQLKMTQLDDFLRRDLTQAYAGLKHCKLVFLGDERTGKSYTAHSLMHKKFNGDSKDSNLDQVSIAKMTQIGWREIDELNHVETVVSKHLSQLEENRMNRYLANESIFQRDERDVVIGENDLALKDSVLKSQNENLLKTLNVDDEEPREEKTGLQLFTSADEQALRTKMENEVEVLMEKAIREHNYPTFSVWDAFSSKTMENLNARLLCGHGLVFVFFSLEALNKNPWQQILSIRKYVASVVNKGGMSKILIIGTHFDTVLNEAMNIEDELGKLKDPRSHANQERDRLVSVTKETFLGYLNEKFLAKEDEPQITEESKEEMEPKKKLQILIKSLRKFDSILQTVINPLDKERRVVRNGDYELCFFPISNELPKDCAILSGEWDDFTGLSTLRATIKWLIKEGKVPIISEMVSLPFASVVDKLISRRGETSIPLIEFRQIAEDCGVVGDNVFKLLSYLDATGIIMWITESEKLRSKVLLTPEFLKENLEEFYSHFSDRNLPFKQDLQNKIEKAGLREEFELFTRSRIATKDLLTQRFLPRQNFEYLMDLLSREFVLNRIDLPALSKLFGNSRSTNPFSAKNIDEGEEYYLVPWLSTPDFSTTLKRQPKGSSLITSDLSFLRYKARFHCAGELPVGSFERFFCLYIASLAGADNSGKRLIFDSERKKATFYFDNLGTVVLKQKLDKIEELPLEKVARLQHTLENDIGGFEVEFEKEKSGPQVMAQLLGVRRKLEKEINAHRGAFTGNFEFKVEVLDWADNDQDKKKMKWVEFSEARQQGLQPYFTTAETAISLDLQHNDFMGI
eukprot:snap_masked-scaffold_13-processed-gene-11.44-mRNA-1 protein AED:1.00 eAED:1.00 QI:0/-1/0/0/-1/1/1/0/1087